jgi:hypothetical protein
MSVGVLMFYQMSETTLSSKQNTIKMKVSTKISLESRWIANQYVDLIRADKTPAILAAWVEKSKYDIMESINDRRLNMSDTLEKIRIEAKFEIMQQLKQNPDLRMKLVSMRKAQNNSCN